MRFAASLLGAMTRPRLRSSSPSAWRHSTIDIDHCAVPVEALAAIRLAAAKAARSVEHVVVGQAAK
jgi:hypothetical protein